MMLNWNKLRYALGAGLIATACGPERLEDVGDLYGKGGAGGAAGAGDIPIEGGSEGEPVVPRAGRSGVGGSGLGGGAGIPGLGEGGAPVVDQLECVEACEVVATASSTITAVVTTEDRVYWTEYGTVDALGNYEENGQLFSLTFEGEEPLLIAAGLQGPQRLMVIEDYAYIVVAPDGAHKLIRVGLDSGQTEIIGAEGAGLSTVVVNGGVAYWAVGGRIERQPEGSSDPAELLFQSTAETEIFEMVGDDTQLYLTDTEGLKTLPYSGGTPTLLRAFTTVLGAPIEQYEALTLAGDYLYALEGALEHYASDEHYVARIPKAGGSWKRVSGVQKLASQLRVDGDTYFTNQIGDRCRYVQGTLGSAEPGAVLAVTPCIHDPIGSWDVAPSSIYVAFENQLLSVSRAP